MTTTMTPEQQLNLAFNEVKSTETALKNSEQAEQTAQAQASDSTGLVAAARRALKNTEARYRVLSSAQAEFNELNEKKDRLDQELADITQAEAVRDATQAAIAPLNAAVAAVTQVITKTNEFIGLTQQAKSDVDDAAQTAIPAAKKNRLAASAQALYEKCTDLEQLQTQLNSSLPSLNTQATTVQTAATTAADYATSLLPDKARIEAELTKVNNKLTAEPPADTISQAGAELDAAQRAFDDAPGAERHAQEVLKVARGAREEAEKRKREALERRDGAERLFIKGIDISGPNSAGVFTATAVLAEPIPSGCELQWSSNAGSVNPDKGSNAVSFDTGGLPPGSYDIEVSLVQTTL
ncbi:MAG: hypothetical protein ACLP8X_08410 [Streptosporangiaceae bacterium]